MLKYTAFSRLNSNSLSKSLLLFCLYSLSDRILQLRFCKIRRVRKMISSESSWESLISLKHRTAAEIMNLWSHWIFSSGFSSQSFSPLRYSPQHFLAKRRAIFLTAYSDYLGTSPSSKSCLEKLAKTGAIIGQKVTAVKTQISVIFSISWRICLNFCSVFGQ